MCVYFSPSNIHNLGQCHDRVDDVPGSTKARGSGANGAVISGAKTLCQGCGTTMPAADWDFPFPFKLWFWGYLLGRVKMKTSSQLSGLAG